MWLLENVKVFYCNAASFDYTFKVSWTYFTNKIYTVHYGISFGFWASAMLFLGNYWYGTLHWTCQKSNSCKRASFESCGDQAIEKNQGKLHFPNFIALVFNKGAKLSTNYSKGTPCRFYWGTVGNSDLRAKASSIFKL